MKSLQIWKSIPIMTASNGHTNNGGGNAHSQAAAFSPSTSAAGDYSTNNTGAVASVVNSAARVVAGGATSGHQSEGWLELFLTPSEKYTFSQWKEVVRDQTLIHSWTAPFFHHCARLLPDSLAPNVITLAGFLSLGQAWYLTNTYGLIYPTACTWLAMSNIFLFFVTNSIAGYHADCLRQHTALSDLFKYGCDMGSTVWLAMLLTYCWLDPTEETFVETQWYAVQASQLVLFLKHLSAYKRKAGLRYRGMAGPGEVLVASMVLLALPAIFGKESIARWYFQQKDVLLKLFANHVVRKLEDSVPSVIEMAPLPQETDVAPHVLMRLAYYILFTTAVVQSLLLSDKSDPGVGNRSDQKQKKHGWTRFGLVTSLLMRFVPAMLLLQPEAGHGSATVFPLTVTDVVCDGLFLTVLTFDLCLAKMSGRELHPWVVLMSLAAVLSTTVVLTLVAVYYIAVFCDLCCYMNLPLLATCRNVYCDGVYDLCHIGHKRAFQNALQLGNRLLVGVVGDEDASHYKRPPIMSHAERCAEVQACKAVTQVIPNAPCFGLTQEFLDQHNIHVVAFGEEYLEKYPDPKDDPYYGLARQLGIGHPLPRTNFMSTTDLIERIQKASIQKKSPT